jgi:AraC-like DNA-binding protein
MEEKIRIESLSEPKEIEAVSYDEKFLSSITQIIEDRLSDSDLNVSALCDISGINNKQIYRKLKQLTGMTPVEYIRSVRMKKAAMLFRQKKFSVAEVMYMVGFSNHSYFSKCFKSEFGKTPWEYMEEY